MSFIAKIVAASVCGAHFASSDVVNLWSEVTRSNGAIKSVDL